MDTDSDEIPFDEQLRHWNGVAAETFSNFLLHFPAHEDVSFHVLDKMSPQYLPDLKAPLVRVSDYAHGGRVQHHFSGFFFLPRLKHHNRIGHYINAIEYKTIYFLIF